MESTEQTNRSESRAIWKLTGYLLWIVLVSTFLLALNAGITFGLVKQFEEYFPNLIGVDVISQLSIYIMPIILLFLEWHLWDILRGSWTRQKT